MSWFAVDDGFYDHPKLEGVDLAAIGLWVRAGSYCSRHLTDGHLSDTRVVALGGSEALAAQLVDAGLWLETDDGYVFHDWLVYQKSRAEITAHRESARQRQAASRERKRNADGTFGVSHANVTRESHVTNGVSHTNVTPQPPTPVTPPHPIPSHPIPIEEPSSLANASDGGSEDPSFAEFWTHYPRKVGKGAARKAWTTAVKKADPSLIIDGCRRYATDPYLPVDKIKIPHPATWLNGERWTDEPCAPPPGTYETVADIFGITDWENDPIWGAPSDDA